MRAIVVREFGGPEVLVEEEVEKPEPTPTGVIVSIKAAGVNPVDCYLRSGIHAQAPKLPYTPGKDGAGMIEAVGEEVTAFKAGDRVYTAGSITGTYAEYSLCDSSQLGRLPDNITFEQGACLWTPYATAFRALFQKASAHAGETVLVHGASGGVGTACIQWAVARGLKVIGTAGSEQGMEMVLKNGASAVLDHNDIDHFSEVRELTDGKGADVIIEMLANQNLERDFEAIAKFGRIVIVGNRGSLQFTPRQAMTNETTIYGMSLFNAPKQDLEEIRNEIFEGSGTGALKPEVAKGFSLEEAPAAHEYIMASKAAGQIVLNI